MDLFDSLIDRASVSLERLTYGKWILFWEGVSKMAELAPRWQADLERGPDCLIIRLRPSKNGPIEDRQLASEMWSLLEQHLVHRLILELDDVGELRRETLGELVKLSRQICERDGLLRICGLSENNRAMLQASRDSERMPHYATREAALMRSRPLTARQF